MVESLKSLHGPELVVGLVARIGVDVRQVTERTRKALRNLNYDCSEIHLTEHLGQFEGLPQTVESPIEERYKTYIAACNSFREQTKRDDIMAFLAITKINQMRFDENGDYRVPIHRKAYLINQLKRPEEIELLRQVYGDLFIQISCHSPKDARQSYLARLIADSHPEEPRVGRWHSTADGLIQQDDEEEDVKNGQRVRDAFPSADFIVNANKIDDAEEAIIRFLNGLFGDFAVSPTKDEYGGHLAYSAALRSLDPSRQVGAAIMSPKGEIMSLGCNEVPKSGGGTYWTGDKPDGRDITLDRDINTIRKRGMVIDIVQRLARNRLLNDDLVNQETNELAKQLLDAPDAPLKDSLILDTLEYGRAMHAEMCAITDAARNGRSLKGCTLFCNTFPCHNCAKHIVGAGITRVVYLRPYPKSFASDLYPDSIYVDGIDETTGRVKFDQFVGVTSRRYQQIFEKKGLKDKFGQFKKWDPLTSSPRTIRMLPDYIEAEAHAINAIADQLPQPFKEQLFDT